MRCFINYCFESLTQIISHLLKSLLPAIMDIEILPCEISICVLLGLLAGNFSDIFQLNLFLCNLLIGHAVSSELQICKRFHVHFSSGAV